MTRNSGDIYVDDFINNVIIESSRLLTEKIPYVAFGIISVGIEFLGKCLDETVKFDEYKRGLPKKHFDLTINSLMPNYIAINVKYDLQDKLRNGFLHSFSPKKPLWLRDKKSATEPHLTEKGGWVHLIIEEFFNDFEKAANQIVLDIKNEKFIHRKMYSPYIQTVL